jgi:hypothetical protein
MKAFLLTGITVGAVAIFARNATAQIGLKLVPQLHDSASTRLLFAPKSTPWQIAANAEPKEAAIRCPMRVFTPDTSKQDRMPIGRPDTASVERMPVAKSACVNPLRRR